MTARENDLATGGKSKPTQKGCVGCVVIIFAIMMVLIAVAIFSSDDQNIRSDSEKQTAVINGSWEKIGHCMCMFSGVKLYYGPNESEYFAQIQCFRGGSDGDVYIINFAGKHIWAKRDAILRAGYYVRKNDPALKAMNYYKCDQ